MKLIIASLIIASLFLTGCVISMRIEDYKVERLN